MDNAFAVPAANRCDLTGIGAVDLLVNLQSGLPAAAGRNTAIQNVEIDFGSIEAIHPGGFEE